MSRLLRAEKRLSYLAHHDSLTGLPNRLLFQDRLAQTLAQAKRSGVQFTLIFIDLDNFKPINDTLGHAIGDRVLQEAANRLSGSVRECDTVARLGGDEFVILAPGLVGDTDIGGLCNKMIDALRQPIQAQGNELFIGGSFGCAEYPNHGDDEVVLLKCADIAMYKAKAAGGNCYAIYEGGALPVPAPEGTP
ncbi:MAG: GGDEF domain-containing protein [Sulfuritalea sp.]|nr:GGDEF domain-containing protein [Sulfuritalea sp.]